MLAPDPMVGGAGVVVAAPSGPATVTDRLALRSVVRFLGVATVINGLLYLSLLGLIVGIAGKTGGSVDPVVAALIGSAIALVTTPATALGTLLLAPSLGRSPDEPQTVKTAPGEVLAVAEAPAPPA